MDKIAVITVIYNNYHILDDLMKSLEDQTSGKYFVYISDLSDNKKKIPNFKIPYKIILLNNNGYAFGINAGLKQAKKDGYNKFAVINSDTVLNIDFIEKCLISLSNNPQNIIGGKIYYAKGYEFHKTRYQKNDLGKIIWYAGGVIDWDNVYIRHRGVDEVDLGKYNLKQETDFITGCLMVFDKSVIDKIGWWDESYFLYYEDADWGERAKSKGIKLIYDPAIVIRHKNAQSTGGSGSALHSKYQNKNRIKFGLKYAPFKTKIHLLLRK